MKNNFKIIVAFILGVVLSGASVYAAVVAANTISYDNSTSGLKDANGNNVTDVQTALDVLYTKANSGSCPEGYVCKQIQKPTVEMSQEGDGKTYKGIIYLDPTDKTVACNASNAVSKTGTISGCMKWYIYKEEGDNYKAILDHNTTPAIRWHGSSNVSLENSNLQAELDSLATYWQYPVSIISAQEISDIVGNSGWSDGGSYYFLDSKSTSKVASSSNKSAYAWLFNYTSGCESDGCDVQESTYYITSYWTSTPKTDTNEIWVIYKDGGLGYLGVSDSNTGIRPVITIPKSEIE